MIAEKQFTIEIRQVFDKDLMIVGQKALSLAKMLRAKLPVPNGFVVTSFAFDDFIKHLKIGKDIVEINNRLNEGDDQKKIKGLALKIQKDISDGFLPEFIKNKTIKAFKSLKSKSVAVRSSAVGEDSSEHSWAGCFETYLNVPEYYLLEMVKKCWASLFTSRALCYKQKVRIKPLIDMAVVVQEMIFPKVAGTASTVDPATKNEDVLRIEAGFGFGSVIVQGRITPDNYLVDKNDNIILEINVNCQKEFVKKVRGGTKSFGLNKKSQRVQKLSGIQILNLAKACCKIEKIFPYPQNIEWGLDKVGFHFLQSRPMNLL